MAAQDVDAQVAAFGVMNHLQVEASPVFAQFNQGTAVWRLMVMATVMVVVSAGGEEQSQGEGEEGSDYLFCFHGHDVGVKFFATSEQ